MRAGSFDALWERFWPLHEWLARAGAQIPTLALQVNHESAHSAYFAYLRDLTDTAAIAIDVARRDRPRAADEPRDAARPDHGDDWYEEFVRYAGRITDITPRGPEGLFTAQQIDARVAILRDVQATATAA